MDPIRSIVVPTDFSPLSLAATARAASLAKIDGASIHLVHALRFPLIATPYEVSVPGAVWEGVRDGAKQRLEEERSAVEARGVAKVTAEVAESSEPAQAIALAVEAHAADLVVMGTHGHGGVRHAFLGSVAERTLRSLDCPVLSVKEDLERAAEPITRILLAVDFSAHSDRAAEVTEQLARSLGAAVDVVHAFVLPHHYIPYVTPLGVELEQQMEQAAAERLEKIRENLTRNRITVTLHSRRGHPSAVIAETAEATGCQLVVMGTRGAGGLSHALLGSVAERTLRTAPCSVLTVKADEA